MLYLISAKERKHQLICPVIKTFILHESGNLTSSRAAISQQHTVYLCRNLRWHFAQRGESLLSNFRWALIPFILLSSGVCQWSWTNPRAVVDSDTPLLWVIAAIYCYVLHTGNFWKINQCEVKHQELITRSCSNSEVLYHQWDASGDLSWKS